MKRLLTVLIILICVLPQVSCSGQAGQGTEITVSAAASLRDAMKEIQPAFEKEKGTKLIFNFAASGTLQKQIEEGAPADLFISAGNKQMDALEAGGLIDKESRSDLLGNRLVLIIPKEYRGKIKEVSDLPDKAGRISIGEPGSVPAGQYAKESLTYMKLWDELQDKIVYAKDVKQVVTYVEAGEADAGIVYKSDAIALKNSTIVQVFDEGSHKPILYPAAIVSASREKEAAKLLLDYLQSDSAKQIFEKYGFEINIK